MGVRTRRASQVGTAEAPTELVAQLLHVPETASDAALTAVLDR